MMEQQEDTSPIRLVAACNQPDVWFNSDDKSGTTEWMGQGFYFFHLFRKVFPDSDVVTDLSPSNITRTQIQTLADLRADVDPSNYGVTYKRFELVDFSYPLDYVGLFIVSAKSEAVSGDVFSGVFDDLSYGMFLVSYLLLALALWAFLRPHKTESWTKTFFYTATTFAGQPLPDSFLRRGPESRSLSVFVTLVALFANTMYSCVIMAKLMSKQEVEAVDTLEALRDRFTAKRILVVQYSFVDEILRSRNDTYSILAPRIDYFADETDPAFYDDLMGKVAAGTHVLIDSNGNFYDKHSKMTRDSQCRIPKRRFRMSKEPLSNVRASWLYRKGLGATRTEEIDVKLMWMQAFGLNGKLKKKGGGIVSRRPRAEEDIVCGEMEETSERDSVSRCGVSSVSAVFPLGMAHMSKVYLMYGVGIGLAAISFIVERCCVDRVKSRIKTLSVESQ